MVPLVELRLAVPMAVGMGLDYFPSLLTCVLGNLIPVPFIYLFARKVLVWGADKNMSASSSVSSWKRAKRPAKSSPKRAAGAVCSSR